jgi:hypothetical protein
VQLQRGKTWVLICIEEERQSNSGNCFGVVEFSSIRLFRLYGVGIANYVASPHSAVSRVGSRGTCPVRHTTCSPGKTGPDMVSGYRVLPLRNTSKQGAQSRPCNYNVSPHNSSPASNALQRQLHRRQARSTYIRTTRCMLYLIYGQVQAHHSMLA